MSEAAISTEPSSNNKTPMWKQAGNWVTRHPALTEFGAAVAFGGVAHFTHSIPALFIFSSAMMTSGVIGSLAKASATEDKVREWVLRGGYFFIGGAIATVFFSSAKDASIPYNLQERVAAVAAKCPSEQSQSIISVSAKGKFTSDQLALTATAKTIDYDKIETTSVTDRSGTAKSTTHYVANYSFKVAGTEAVKNFWRPGYSLRLYNQTFSDIKGDNCKLNAG